MNAIEVTQLLEPADEILLNFALEHLSAGEGEVAA